jgi:hypothetical protein
LYRYVSGTIQRCAELTPIIGIWLVLALLAFLGGACTS